MKNYTIYFEIYGKKMKTTVMAKTEDEAKELVKGKIIFHKVEKSKDDFNEAIDIIDNILNIIGRKNRT
jgi:DUF438 domain-containing protein